MTQNIRASDNFVGSCEDTRNINTLNILYTYILEKMARNFTAYPTVAPKIRVYGDTVFKFDPCSFTSKSGKLLNLIFYSFYHHKCNNTIFFN